MPTSASSAKRDVQAEIELAAKLGRAIYEQDEATAHATDAILALNGGPDPRVRGWVTRASGDGFTTAFIMPDGDQLAVPFEARTPPGGAPVASKVDPPRTLDPEGATMFRAMRTASHVLTTPCGDSYNSVILPGALAGQQGWLVYFLAATTRPEILVLGGHHRILVSGDGARVLEHTPLSKECLIQRVDPNPNHKLTGLVVTSLVADHPLESHFFTSLHYKLPLAVAAGDKIWVLEGDRIVTVRSP